MSLAEKYKRSLEEQRLVRFKTNHPDGDRFDGVVVVNARQFVAIQIDRDFVYDGIVILPKRVIRGYRDGAYEDCRSKIAAALGIEPPNIVPSWLAQCETLREVFQGLKRSDIWPAVEEVKRDRNDDTFVIGRIVDVPDNSVRMLCYNAVGEWDEVAEISIRDVFKIDFLSSYVSTFNRYMAEFSPPDQEFD